MLMISIGSDPEVFVYEQGNLSAGIGKLGGEKNKPIPYKNIGIQEDNVLAEFNIKPCSSFESFDNELEQAMKNLRHYCKQRGLDIKVESSNEYSFDALQKFGKKALEFGCDPDFNAYTGVANESPNAKSTLRTAGGHVHIGYFGNIGEAYQQAVARACDLYLGVPSVLLDRDTRRRSMYGKAGAFRPKEYGIEYRSLSNFWIDDSILRRWVYNGSQKSVRHATVVDLITARFGGAERIIDCINNSDVDFAHHICNELGMEIPA